MSEQSEGQSRLLAAGRYRGRARDGVVGMTSKGKPEVAVLFELEDPQGWTIAWYGFFTEKTEESTLKALLACGWDGEDITALTGITENVVELVIEVEEQEDENGQKTGEWRNRVRWVNPVGSASMLIGKEMDDATKVQFATAMRGRALALKQKLSSGKSSAPPEGATPASTADVGEPPPWAR